MFGVKWQASVSEIASSYSNCTGLSKVLPVSPGEKMKHDLRWMAEAFFHICILSNKLIPDKQREQLFRDTHFSHVKNSDWP